MNYKINVTHELISNLLKRENILLFVLPNEISNEVPISNKTTILVTDIKYALMNLNCLSGKKNRLSLSLYP